MPIQTFHAIGNHDHDMAVQNIAGDDDSAAELAYISALGPTYYAVNIGKVHYVVFDNTQYVNTGGDRSFAVRLNRRQMDWAQKDADYMPSDVERIVIAWHCPAFRRNPGPRRSTRWTTPTNCSTSTRTSSCPSRSGRATTTSPKRSPYRAAT